MRARINNYIRSKAVSLKKYILKPKPTREESLKLARHYADKTWSGLKDGMKAVGKEANETEEMAISFFKLLEHKLNLKERTDPPTEEEVKKAIEQLKDVGRFSFFATMVILPGGVISLVGLELLAKKIGLKDFTLIPTSFRKKMKDAKESDPKEYAELLKALGLPENPESLESEEDPFDTDSSDEIKKDEEDKKTDESER